MLHVYTNHATRLHELHAPCADQTWRAGKFPPLNLHLWWMFQLKPLFTVDFPIKTSIDSGHL